MESRRSVPGSPVGQEVKGLFCLIFFWWCEWGGGVHANASH